MSKTERLGELGY